MIKKKLNSLIILISTAHLQVQSIDEGNLHFRLKILFAAPNGNIFYNILKNQYFSTTTLIEKFNSKVGSSHLEILWYK